MKIFELTETKITELENISDSLITSLNAIIKEPLDRIIFAESDKYITPYAVIAVSNSSKQIDAILTNIIKSLKKKSLFNTEIKIDGNGERGWCIIDLSNCLINIMTPQKFEKYALEEIIKGNFRDV